MGIKINEYPDEALTIGDEDFYDVDVWDSDTSTFESQKISGLTLKSQINPRLYAQTVVSTLITNTTLEKSLIGMGVGSLMIPAKTFKVGDSFTVRLCGPISCLNNSHIEFNILSNGSILLANSGDFELKITTDKFFELNLDFTVTKIGPAGAAELFTNGQFTYNQNSNNALDGVNFSTINNTTFNCSIDNTLDITAQWVTASTSNKIQSQNLVLIKTY